MENMRIAMLVILLISGIFCFVGCVSQQTKPAVSNDILLEIETPAPNIVARSRRLDGKPCSRKVDWEAYYQSSLKRYGVDDFSNQNLIKLLDSENNIIKMNSAWLLGFRKNVSAIPKLEETLNCESVSVKKAVTRSLLRMGNRRGVPVLQKFIERASKEMQEGDYKDTVDMAYAADILADANETAVIPYLRQLANFQKVDQIDGWSTRLMAMRSLAKLHEKAPSVLADIALMKNDKNPQVRKEAAEIIKRIEAKKKTAEPNQ